MDFYLGRFVNYLNKLQSQILRHLVCFTDPEYDGDDVLRGISILPEIGDDLIRLIKVLSHTKVQHVFDKERVWLITHFKYVLRGDLAEPLTRRL